MESLSSKDVKRIILEYDDLGQLNDFIDIDFKNTVIGIFNALFVLLKNSDRNTKIIDYLITFLENLVMVRDVEELKLLIGPIIDLQNKVNSFKLKDRIKIKNSCYRIQSIFNSVQVQLSSNNRFNLVRCLEFLIFYDKNLTMIKNFLKEKDDVLKYKNQDGEYIFDLLIQKYIQSCTDEDIDYFYQVILSFFHSKYGDELSKNSDYYLKLIYSSDMYYKEHVVKLISLFDSNFFIKRDDFEKYHGIYFQFPDSLLNEMNTFKMKKKKRIDYTDLECITIDGVHSFCLDDAMSVKKNEDGTYSLYIHIADIASFVPYFSMIREEAFLREETLYLRDDNVLLYPSWISDQVCSLIPDNYRNTVTYEFRLDSSFKVIPGSFDVNLGKIRVTHKLSYEEVDARIRKPLGNELDELLYVLAEFANVRRKKNLEKETYREYENLFQMDDYHESLMIDTSVGANIVHESMILVNYKIAKYFKDMGYPYIYRGLYVPSDDFINEQVKRLKMLGIHIGDNRSFCSTLRDSYIKSKYCSSPMYHSGMKLECYSHSTSPLRRYMDGLGQFIIHDILIDAHVDDANIYTWEYRVNRAVSYANEKVKKNEQFSREYNYLSYKKLLKK